MLAYATLVPIASNTGSTMHPLTMTMFHFSAHSGSYCQEISCTIQIRQGPRWKEPRRWVKICHANKLIWTWGWWILRLCGGAKVVIVWCQRAANEWCCYMISTLLHNIWSLFVRISIQLLLYYPHSVTRINPYKNRPQLYNIVDRRSAIGM